MIVGSKNYKDAAIFLTPVGILFFCFLLLPIIIVIFLSFTEYDIIHPIEFVGLKNFIKVFNTKSIGLIFNTSFNLAFTLVILHAVIGLLLALIVKSSAQKIQGFYRFMVYVPVTITTASMAVAWSYMFNQDFGAINWFLGLFGIEKIPWLVTKAYVLDSIRIFSVWKFVGNSFLYYFIGLCTIPEELYEASYIDGANAWQRFWKITLPMLTPTIFFVTVVMFINTLQCFDEPFFITKGGPGEASKTICLLIYQKAFNSYDMGYASAISVILFLIILTITVVQNILSKKWVNYDR